MTRLPIAHRALDTRITTDSQPTPLAQRLQICWQSARPAVGGRDAKACEFRRAEVAAMPAICKFADSAAQTVSAICKFAGSAVQTVPMICKFPDPPLSRVPAICKFADPSTPAMPAACKFGRQAGQIDVQTPNGDDDPVISAGVILRGGARRYADRVAGLRPARTRRHRATCRPQGLLTRRRARAR